jgi:hypothetical protein
MPFVGHLPRDGFNMKKFNVACPKAEKTIQPFAVLLKDVESLDLTDVMIKDYITNEMVSTVKLDVVFYSPVVVGQVAEGSSVLTLWRDEAKNFKERLIKDFELRKNLEYIIYIITFGAKDPSWILWNISSFDVTANNSANIIPVLRKIVFRVYGSDNEVPQILEWDELCGSTLFCMKDDYGKDIPIADVMQWVPIKKEFGMADKTSMVSSPVAKISPFKKARTG